MWLEDSWGERGGGGGVLLLGSLKVTEKIRFTENDIVFFRSVSRKITDVIFKFSLCLLSVW